MTICICQVEIVTCKYHGGSSNVSTGSVAKSLRLAFQAYDRPGNHALKHCFPDSGILCYLLKLTQDSPTKSPFPGTVWERLVYAEIRSAISLGETPASLW